MNRKATRIVSSITLITMFAGILQVGAENQTKTSFEVDNKSYEVSTYLSDGQPYYNLRDIASVLKYTPAEFSIDFDSDTKTIVLNSDEYYNFVEITPTSTPAFASNHAISIDDSAVSWKGMNIGGSNYYTLSDLSSAFNFESQMNEDKVQIIVPNDSRYMENLDSLTIDEMRKSTYDSTLSYIESKVDYEQDTVHFLAYDAGDTRQYTRIDIPTTPMPENGYPVVIFAHGWVGIDAAPTWHFGMDETSQYGKMVKEYTDAGFVTLMPGFSGHGTFGDIPADGLNNMSAFDNGSYLMPIFYAQDLLNLLEGLDTFENIDWENSGVSADTKINLDNINLSAHSQGGDVALTALAVSGEGATEQTFANASIWAGCFPDRTTQLVSYYPMEKTLEAFMSGDGTWNGTAIGADGEINHDFIFGYPPDWIGTVDTTSEDWTWQADYWGVPTVAEALDQKTAQMYSVYNTYFTDLADFTYVIEKDETGKSVVVHDETLEAELLKIGGFQYPEYITENLILQVSDQDFYSHVEWNEDLSNRINAAGGNSTVYVYEQNSHGLRASSYDWFADDTVVEGYSTAMQRDIELFKGK